MRIFYFLLTTGVKLGLTYSEMKVYSECLRTGCTRENLFVRGINLQRLEQTSH
jgi:hypothetical protein